MSEAKHGVVWTLGEAAAIIERQEAKIVALIKAGDRVAAACEVLARKLNDCTNEDLAEAVAAWTAWRREAKSDG